MPVLMYHPDFDPAVHPDGSIEHPIAFPDSAAPHYQREGGWLVYEQPKTKKPSKKDDD